MQKNITGASSVPFLDAFSAGFNAGNGIVNAWRTREDNKRLRDFQKKQDDFNPENGNGNVPHQQQQLAQAQQIAYNNPEKISFSNVFSMGQNPYNTSGGDIVNYNGRYFNSLQDNNPFGVSANDKGQRIAEQGSISPDLSNYNTSLQQVWGTGQTEQPQVQQVQPQVQQQLSDYEARMNALPTAQNLDGRYSLSNYLNYARQNGMGNTQAMLNYYAFAMPFEQEARKARLEENFKIYNDPNATDEMKSRALAGMSYDLQNPDLVYDATQKRLKDQMALEDRDYSRKMAMNKIIADMGYIPPGFEQYLNGETLGEEDEQPSANYSGVNLEGKSWIRNNNNVDLSNAKPNTITGLNHISDIFQKMTGKPLIVTSGNDGKMHASGEFSHGNGWKVDVSGNGLDDPKTRHAFIKQCENLGIKVLDEYENPSPNSTGGHLDLQFSGYTGSRPKKVSGFGQLRLTPKELSRRAREARAEARELRAEQREARRAALDEANFKLKLATYNAKYGNGATGKGKTKGMTETQIKKYEDAKRDFVNSGRKISELEGKETLVIDGLTGKTKNPYEEEMKNFTKHLDSIYQVEYGNVDTSKVTPLQIATHLYNRINSNEEGEFKMGITENTLADVVSRVVASRNSSVMPKDLKEDLLKVIYNQAEVEKSPNADMEYHMAEDQNAAMKDYMNNDPETGKPLSKEEWLKIYRPNGKPNARKDTLYKAFGEYFPDGTEKVFDLGG